MRDHGVEVVDLDLDECIDLMRSFVATHTALWNEDIGIVTEQR